MRDDDYQRTAKALARETRMRVTSVERIEQELVSAMSSRDADDALEALVRRPPQRLTWLPPSGGRSLLSIAATVTLVAGSIALWTVSRRAVNTIDQGSLQATSISRDVVLPATPKVIVPTTANPSQQPRGNRAAQRSQTARVVSPRGFVELPWTAGLPAFESGAIVRMEVPVASLPAYGFDISRGSDRAVEADVLIGQDGLARAMRLVSNSTRSTQ